MYDSMCARMESMKEDTDLEVEGGVRKDGRSSNGRRKTNFSRNYVLQYPAFTTRVTTAYKLWVSDYSLKSSIGYSYFTTSLTKWNGFRCQESTAVSEIQSEVRPPARPTIPNHQSSQSSISPPPQPSLRQKPTWWAPTFQFQRFTSAAADVSYMI